MIRAFSLVELSIVLVILGLLTGGILAGQSLIRAAELRSVTTEYHRWITATEIFRGKYLALPGDTRDATRFWNKHSTNCPTHIGVDDTNGTCNGNGDGRIIYTVSNPETWLFWQHLAKANLIEGSYTGLYGPGGIYDAVPGGNVPSSRLSQSGWFIRTETVAFTGQVNFFDGDYGTRFQFGADGGASNTMQAPNLSPPEAWGIDMKIDDGKPGRGTVVVAYRTACTNSSSSNDKSADYKLDISEIMCALNFLYNNPLQ